MTELCTHGTNSFLIIQDGSLSTLPDINEDPGVTSNLTLNTAGDIVVHLPTITEASVTAAATQKPDEHPGISQIFPDQTVAGAAQELRRQQRKLSGRVRTTSASGTEAQGMSRFQVGQNRISSIVYQPYLTQAFRILLADTSEEKVGPDTEK